MNLLILADPQCRVLFAGETDRGEDDFPPTATWGRDHVFVLAHAGSLDGLGDLAAGRSGAVYVQTEPWRITTKSVDRPRPKRVRKARVFDLAKFRAARVGGAA